MSAQDTHSHSENVREREVIVTDGGSRGFGGAMMAIVALVALVLVGILAFNMFAGGGGGDESVIPDEVNLNIDGGSGGGEG